MRIDSISLSEGSTITNLTVASGTTFSLTPDIGELFFRTTDSKLYVYNGSAWISVSASAVAVESVAGRTGVVTLSATDISGLSTVATSGSYTDLSNKPFISGSNTGDQTITLVGDVTGSGTGSFNTTLATVNASPQSDTFRKISVNSKGLVTASTAVGSLDIISSLGYTPYNGATNPNGYTTNTGTVTTVSIVSANGISGSVATAGATPAITLSLGAITPSSISTTGNVTVGGNLIVNGTTTTINATTLDVADLNITLGSGATTAIGLEGAGLTFGNYTDSPTLKYVSGLDRLKFSREITAPRFYGDVTGDVAGNVTGNVTGNVSGTAATITGIYGGSLTSLQITTGLGFTPYNATNPNNFTANLGTITQVTATAPVQSSGGTTPVISMTTASGTSSGYLTSTDWTTFNNKSNTSGTVTSVGLSAPNIFTVTNSPVSSSGTLTLTLAAQSANTVFAGPATGVASAPAFRALVAADIPALSYAAPGQTMYIGTTAVAINRASAALALTGITSIDGPTGQNFTLQTVGTTSATQLILSGNDVTTAAAQGGAINIHAGAGGAGGLGGDVTISGGTAGSGGAMGGSIYIASGTSATGHGGDTFIAGGTGNSGGDVVINGGTQTGGGLNGDILIGNTTSRWIKIGRTGASTAIMGPFQLASLLTAGFVKTDSSGSVSIDTTAYTTNTGTVTSASVTTANGVSATVATATTTPAFTFTLGAITPTSVASTGAISGTTLTATGAISGTRFTSTVASGTAPLTVTSPTLVSNLNADMIDGIHSSQLVRTDTSFIAGHNAGGRYMASAVLMNDFANARLRGSVFTLTNITATDPALDILFDGTSSIFYINTATTTWPIVIEFTLPKTLGWTTSVGIGFSNVAYRTNSVKIEAFSEGAWVTCIDTASNASEDVLVSIPGNAAVGTTKVRYTLDNPNTTVVRICHLWGFNHNSDGWTQLQMPRAGGTMYGALTVSGAVSGTSLVSSATQGTPPLTVTSNSLVPNLNADLLDGMDAKSTNTVSSVVARDANGDFSAGTITANLAGTASSVTTNANLTGPITSVGNTTSVASQTGTGSIFVMNTSPTLVTPNIGVATGTSFNSITGLSSTNPIMNGTAAAGSGATVARADHVHPSDTAKLSLSGGTMTGSIVIPTGQDITLTDLPTAGTDAVNKNYVDAAITGLTWKNSAAVGTTANINLATGGLLTIDGYQTVAGDRAVVKNQTTQSENGIYDIAVGAWTRSADANSGSELNHATIFIEHGATQAATGWTVSNVTLPVLGTDAITFVQFNGAAGVTAGVGLTKTGNVLDVDAAQPGITSLGTLSSLTTTGQITSTLATGGAAPLVVASNTLVTNLNADLLDGNQASAFALSGHTHSYLSAEVDTLSSVTSRGATTSTAITLSGSPAITLSNATTNIITTGTNVALQLRTQDSASAATGNITLTSGAVTGGTFTAGSISIYPGLSTTTAGSNTSISGGISSIASSTGGHIFLTGGTANTTATNGHGGSIYIIGGEATAPTGTNGGGDIYIEGGHTTVGDGSGDGNIYLGTGTSSQTNASTNSINIGRTGITTTVTGTVKLPTLGTSGFVKLTTGGQLTNDTTTYATGGGSATGTNTGDNAVNTLYSGLVSNATHTGDVTGSTALTIATGAVTLSKMADVATGTVFYRKTAATGAPEVQTLAALKTDLGLTGTNSGDQTIPTTLPNPNAITFSTTGGAVAGSTYSGAAALTVSPTTIGAQPQDADLTAIAGLAGTSGLLKKTAADTWTLDTTAYTTNLGTVTSITATSPLTGGTITSSGSIGIQVANTSQSGYLSSADWNTFNGKQAAGSYQPQDADLTAIAGLAGTSGLLKKTAADTWTLDTTAYTTNLGTVTAVSIATANGVSGSSSGGATPALTITLGTITPSGINATGAISGTTLTSTLATGGAAPLVVASNTLVTNLNADLLDGNHAAAFALSGHTHAYLSAEADTLATVTGRGASTATAITLSGSPALTLSNATTNIITTGTNANLQLRTQDSASASTGGLTLTTGNVTGGTFSAGGISIYPGLSTTSAAPSTSVAGGISSIASSTGGHLFLTGGSANATATNGHGGSIYIIGGEATATTGTNGGGDIYIEGGHPSNGTTNGDGNVNIATGTSLLSNAGSNSVNIGRTAITTTVNGTVKLPNVGTSGFVKIGAGGILTNDTTAYTANAGTVTSVAFTGGGGITGTVTNSTSAVSIALTIGAVTGTSFNGITGLASTAPVMDGTENLGISSLVAKQDHRHPSDTSRLALAGGTMIGSITIPSGQKITITDLPSSGTDAANKNYVDASLAGLTWKNAAAVATTANITLSATPIIDTYQTVVGDRILVKDQTTQSQNGIYVVAAGAWARAADASTGAELDHASLFVEHGSANIATAWTVSNTTTPTIDVTAITFAKFTGGSSITNGTGLSLVGNVMSVKSAVTFNSTGSGDASGTTYSGETARTISYNTIGAQVAGTYVTPTTLSNSSLAVAGTTGAFTTSLSLGAATQASTPRQTFTILNSGYAVPSAPNLTSLGDKNVFWNAATLKIAQGVNTSTLWFQSTNAATKFYTGTTTPVLALTINPDTSIVAAGSYSGTTGAFSSTLDVTGIATLPKINLNKATTASGILWYNSTYTAWQDYMAQAATTTNGVSGTITAPTGTLVTTWGRRSFIENTAGMGWTFESGTNASTTPAIVAEISSVNGAAKFGGNVSAPTLTSTVATGTAPFTVTSTTPVANLSIGGTAGSETLTTVTGRGATTTSSITMPGTEGVAYGFWATTTTYSIAMGVSAATYQYGPVTDYSIKMNMGGGAGRGFTWGQNGVKPIAALNATTGDMTIAGAFSAATKSFLIDHPLIEGKKLRHGSLEGPEHGVYVRGRLKGDTIELPDYWTKLVDPESITVQLTPVGSHQKLYVKEIGGNKVVVGNENLFGTIDCFYIVNAERIDVAKMVIEE